VRASKTSDVVASAPSPNLNAMVTNLVNEQMKKLTKGLSDAPCSSSGPKKRSFSLREESSDESDDDKPPHSPPNKKNKEKAMGAPSTAPSPTPPPLHAQTTSTEPKEYSTQVIILKGVKEDIKSHPLKLSAAFAKAKPNLALKPGGLRLTRSGHVLVIPKHPKDCNSLLKPGAFPSESGLGEAIEAEVPKSQQITHQVIITKVDTSVTQEEMVDVLNRQELPFKMVKRIWSRQRDAATNMFRLILKSEDQKRKLLREGIFLDQAHFQCVVANEDKKDFQQIKQCFNCQEIGDHFSASCTGQLKCVLCAGPHRKQNCDKPKEQYKCANCSKNHAAWSPECEARRTESLKSKRPTMAQVASATVTPALLDEVLNQVKESIALIVAEVVSRCLCELTYDLLSKSVSKATLPLKVASIAKSAAMAASKITLGSKPFTVDTDTVKNQTVEKCFPKTIQSAPPSQSLTDESLELAAAPSLNNINSRNSQAPIS
jgi:hypothetical protein